MLDQKHLHLEGGMIGDDGDALGHGSLQEGRR
jgi:hypothetical protein